MQVLKPAARKVSPAERREREQPALPFPFSRPACPSSLFVAVALLCLVLGCEAANLRVTLTHSHKPLPSCRACLPPACTETSHPPKTCCSASLPRGDGYLGRHVCMYMHARMVVYVRKWRPMCLPALFDIVPPRSLG
ncbi:uncharacterized protein K452DRAFT_54887 [Aplosporella prunicola CBS 121167]|uniref:Uncharacterized protein n=1 Tax=Aplosporella prunicola CBS 121167 TaxID=1176127 RepID=A0A6A6B838_9PEZI|nr:uncharacterized protein K452DRAFT_54887 [Aplosporella prunicola CBS 121167]KAF2140372.1 hypothetical protein K452DRAFT_54887 [Aplosporella prunicola CBS 121167]